MIAEEGPPPQIVKAAALLTVAAPLLGAVVTVLNIAASAQAEQVVREAMAGRPDLVRFGLQHVDTVAWARTVEIGALFVVSALVTGALVWIASRGSSRWAGLVPLLAVAVSVSYVWWLRQAYSSNPVANDFWYPLWDLWYAANPDMGGREPFTGHLLYPPQYEGILAATLVVAAAVQLMVPILLRPPASVRGLKGIAVRTQRVILLALVGPVSALLYAAINFLGIKRAFDLADDWVFPHAPTHEAASAWATTAQIALVLLVMAGILAAMGIRLSRNKGSALLYAALTVPYALILLYALLANLSEMSNETSGFTDFRPWWRTSAVVNIIVIAGLAQVASVVHTIRRGSG